MHDKQDVPCFSRLPPRSPNRIRTLTFRPPRPYDNTHQCEFRFRPFDLRTRTTSEDAAERRVGAYGSQRESQQDERGQQLHAPLPIA